MSDDAGSDADFGISNVVPDRESVEAAEARELVPCIIQRAENGALAVCVALIDRKKESEVLAVLSTGEAMQLAGNLLTTRAVAMGIMAHIGMHLNSYKTWAEIETAMDEVQRHYRHLLKEGA